MRIPEYRFRPLSAWLMAAMTALLLLAGCKLFGGEDPEGTEVENEIVGRIYLAEGGPAEGAEVTLVPVAWIPGRDAGDTSAGRLYSAHTDAEGAYRFAALDPGRYNVLGKLGERVSFQDSLLVTSDTDSLPPDTLDASGSVTGFVAVQPNHLPSIATVEILGTQSFANVDESGRFHFPSLAAGRYSVRVITTTSGYTPLYTGFPARTGRHDTLPDTLTLPYTDIPVVVGVKVAYDTLAGVARLSWRPVRYGLLSDYEVYRDEAGYQELSRTPLARVSDTFFADTLYRIRTQEEAFLQESLSVRYEYRLRARDKSDRSGPSFGFTAVDAPSPAMVRTFLNLAAPGLPALRASIGDTARILLEYRNRTRVNDSLSWHRNSEERPLRTGIDLGLSGRDSLEFALPARAGTDTVRVRMRDAGGTVWHRSLQVSVLEDRPIVSAGRDTIVSTGMSLELKGSARQEFGSILSWEWDIGGLGRFIRTSRPETTITLPALPDSAYLCILRATDDDGGSGLDTLRIVVSPSRKIPRAPLPDWSFTTTIRDSLIYFLEDFSEANSLRFWEYHVASGALRVLQPLAGRRGNVALLAFAGKIHAIGGYVPSPSQAGRVVPTHAVETYDPASDSWSAGTPMRKPRVTPIVGVHDGKIHVLLGEIDTPSGEVYDPATATWTDLPAFPSTLQPQFLEGIFAGNLAHAIQGSKHQIYDPASGQWTEGIWPSDIQRPGLVEWGGKVVAMGGMTTPMGAANPVLWKQVIEYDPVRKSWNHLPVLLNPRSVRNVERVGKDILVLDGACGGTDVLHMETCADWEAYTLP